MLEADIEARLDGKGRFGAKLWERGECCGGLVKGETTGDDIELGKTTRLEIVADVDEAP